MNDDQDRPPQYDYYEQPPNGYPPRDVFGLVALAALSVAVMAWLASALWTWLTR
jgi:hypothetical protein